MASVTISVDLDDAKKLLASHEEAVREAQALLAQRKAARDAIASQIAKAETPSQPAEKPIASVAIHSVIASQPGRRMTQKQIVEETCIPQPTVAKALKKLVSDGALLKEGNLYSSP